MVEQQPSSQISAKAFRQIFTWPFVKAPESSSQTWYDTCTKKLRQDKDHWTETAPTDLIEDGEKTGLYEEAVYFHDFIRDSLYCPKSQSENAPPFVCFKRASLTQITFTLPPNAENAPETTHTFTVEFCAFHVYRAGVAILTLELIHDGPLNLDVAQRLTDCLRRACLPYWAYGNPGLSPKHAQLSETTGDFDCPLSRLQSQSKARNALLANDFREPMFGWWRRIVSR